MWTLGWGDPSTQMLYDRFHFEESDRTGGVVRGAGHPGGTEWHARRDVGRFEMQLLLEKYGFTVETVFGDLGSAATGERFPVYDLRGAQDAASATACTLRQR